MSRWFLSTSWKAFFSSHCVYISRSKSLSLVRLIDCIYDVERFSVWSFNSTSFMNEMLINLPCHIDVGVIDKRMTRELKKICTTFKKIINPLLMKLKKLFLREKNCNKREVKKVVCHKWQMLLLNIILRVLWMCAIGENPRIVRDFFFFFSSTLKQHLFLFGWCFFLQFDLDFGTVKLTFRL